MPNPTQSNTEADIATTGTLATKSKMEMQLAKKPKRKLTKPAYLNDYV